MGGKSWGMEWKVSLRVGDGVGYLLAISSLIEHCDVLITLFPSSSINQLINCPLYCFWPCLRYLLYMLQSINSWPVVGLYLSGVLSLWPQ